MSYEAFIINRGKEYSTIIYDILNINIEMCFCYIINNFKKIPKKLEIKSSCPKN